MTDETCQRCGNPAYGSPLCDSCLDYAFTGKNTYNPEGAGYLTGLDLAALDHKQVDLATALKQSPREIAESEVPRQHWMRVVDNYYKNAAQSPPAEILTQPDITASNQATMSPLPSHVVASVEFASIFISYCRPDERFAISLNEELIARGVQTFIERWV